MISDLDFGLWWGGSWVRNPTHITPSGLSVLSDINAFSEMRIIWKAIIDISLTLTLNLGSYKDQIKLLRVSTKDIRR